MSSVLSSIFLPPNLFSILTILRPLKVIFCVSSWLLRTFIANKIPLFLSSSIYTLKAMRPLLLFCICTLPVMSVSGHLWFWQNLNGYVSSNNFPPEIVFKLLSLLFCCLFFSTSWTLVFSQIILQIFPFVLFTSS